MNNSLSARLAAPCVALGLCAAASAAGPVEALPKAVNAQVLKAQSLRLHDQPAQARALLEPIVRKYPSNYLARYNLGLTYSALKDNSPAVAELSAAKKLNIDQHLGEPTIYNSLGWAQFQSGDYQAALKEFTTARSPEVFNKLPAASQRKVLNNTGLAYAYLGQSKEAEKLYKSAAAVPSTTTQATSASTTK